MVDYYSGYYLKGQSIYEIEKILQQEKIEDYPEIEFDDPYETCPYDSASDFLMGSCELFALALHNKFGYTVFEIVSSGRLVHTFCMKAGSRVFIDIRGITSNEDDFMSGVRILEGDGYEIRPRDISEDQGLLNEWDSLAMEFANAIINRHPKYYEVNL